MMVLPNHPVFTSKNRALLKTKESLRSWQTWGSLRIQFFWTAGIVLRKPHRRI
jgi:hypothetical protein